MQLSLVVSAIAICVLSLALVVDTYKERNKFIFCLDIDEAIAAAQPDDDYASSYVPDFDFTCICADNKYKIYSYNMHWGLECDQVMTKYDDELTTSCVFLFLCAFCILAYHALTWMSLSEMNGRVEGAHNTGRNSEPAGGAEMVPTAPAKENNYTKV